MFMKTVAGAVVALGLAAVPALADYPAKEIQGIIQWGAGGSPDTVARAITPGRPMATPCFSAPKTRCSTR